LAGIGGGWGRAYLVGANGRYVGGHCPLPEDRPAPTILRYHIEHTPRPVMLRHEASTLPASSKQLVNADASLRNRHDKTLQYLPSARVSKC
jgi:hypothetical protein